MIRLRKIMVFQILRISTILLFTRTLLAYAYNTPVTVTAPEKSRGQSHVASGGNCEDMHGSLSLNFQNVGLQRIDSYFANNANVSCLSLEDNEIAYISPNAFHLMPNLLYLNLARNKLDLANFSQLTGHSNLRTLILDENASPSSAVEGTTLEFVNKFPRLIHLYLRGNGLRNISLAFAPKLTHLYLSSNNLSDSELSFLENAPASLQILDLAENGVQSLNASVLTLTRDLRLDGNQIKRLCGKSYCRDSALVLEGATRLRRLSLARNGLTSIEPDAFDDTENLLDLDLSYNRIDSIRKNTFERVAMLRNLSLKENLLSEMPDFYGPESLEYLSLANNQLESVINESFADLDKLRFIDLSSNKINSIQAGAFSKQILLEFLDLSNNRLTNFPYKWLTPLTNLRVLHVTGNLLNKLDDLKLGGVRIYGKLERVYLQNNSITKFNTSSLYNAFRNIPNVTLVFFDVDDQSKSLQQIASNADICKCDCDEINEIL